MEDADVTPTTCDVEARRFIRGKKIDSTLGRDCL